MVGMSSRKPPGVSWESWTERAIREGMEQGQFDNLAGQGRPIDGLGEPHDELWWVKRKLVLEDAVVLPPALALRRDREQLLANLASFSNEEAVRRVTDELNERIRRLNRYGAEGPPSTLMPLDLDDVISRWRQAVAGSGGPSPSEAPHAGSA